MSILIKVRYSDCKFASFFMERDEISFVSLVEKIKENCISLSHLEATSMRIKYKDEDDDLVNLRHDSAAVKEMLRCSRDVQGQEFRKVFLYAAELDSPVVVPNRSERNQRCQTEPGASCLPPRQLFEAASPKSAEPHQQTPFDKLKFDLAENVQIKRVLVQSAEEELSRLTGEQNDLQQLSALKGRVCGICHKQGHLRPRCTNAPCTSHTKCRLRDKNPELKQKINVLQKELKRLQNDAESAESRLKGFCEARSKASTSFFSVMRPRLKCRNLMRYSERVQLDRDLFILKKALNGKVPDFVPSEDWKLPILVEQYKNRNVNMYTTVTRAILLALQLGALEQFSLFVWEVWG